MIGWGRMLLDEIFDQGELAVLSWQVGIEKMLSAFINAELETAIWFTTAYEYYRNSYVSCK